MTLKDVTQLVHARLNYHALKDQLTFKYPEFLRHGACYVNIHGMLILHQ